jgi:hypothetical protein
MSMDSYILSFFPSATELAIVPCNVLSLSEPYLPTLGGVPPIGQGAVSGVTTLEVTLLD